MPSYSNGFGKFVCFNGFGNSYVVKTILFLGCSGVVFLVCFCFVFDVVVIVFELPFVSILNLWLKLAPFECPV